MKNSGLSTSIQHLHANIAIAHIFLGEVAAAVDLEGDPAGVRHWPAQRMPAFDKSTLSDLEIDNIIAYLTHMAGRKKPAG